MGAGGLNLDPAGLVVSQYCLSQERVSAPLCVCLGSRSERNEPVLSDIRGQLRDCFHWAAIGY